MKTVVTFDTSLIADSDRRSSVEQAPGREVAATLRALADECDKGDRLPSPKALLLTSGELAGSVRTEFTHDDEGLVFLTTKNVIEKTGMPNTTLQRRRETDPDFPKPVILSVVAGKPRTVRWVKREVEAWMAGLLCNRAEAPSTD